MSQAGLKHVQYLAAGCQYVKRMSLGLASLCHALVQHASSEQQNKTYTYLSGFYRMLLPVLLPPPTAQDNPQSGPRITPPRQRQNEDDGGGFRQRQHSAVQALPISPACCVITSDPTTALVPELPFPKVMLTDRSRRASLFSLTQTVLGAATPEGSSLGRPREGLWQCNNGGIGAGRSVVELLRRTSPALPEVVSTEASAIFQEVLRIYMRSIYVD